MLNVLRHVVWLLFYRVLLRSEGSSVRGRTRSTWRELLRARAVAAKRHGESISFRHAVIRTRPATRGCTVIGAATCLLLLLPLAISGCRGNEEQRLRAQPRTAPVKVAKRIPNLIGMTYEEARARFLKAGGAVVRAKPTPSPKPRGTVIGQQPPPGERFTHSIELVVAHPLDER